VDEIDQTGCCKKDGEKANAFWLAPLALLWRRRRARA
jgi:hypothetical protein